MKNKETLEEAFVRFMEINYSGQLTKGFVLGAMKFASKWQAERMYSEEDLEQAHFEGKVKKQSFKEWFEQFKKK